MRAPGRPAGPPLAALQRRARHLLWPQACSLRSTKRRRRELVAHGRYVWCRLTPISVYVGPNPDCSQKLPRQQNQSSKVRYGSAKASMGLEVWAMYGTISLNEVRSGDRFDPMDLHAWGPPEHAVHMGVSTWCPTSNFSACE